MILSSIPKAFIELVAIVSRIGTRLHPKISLQHRHKEPRGKI